MSTIRMTVKQCMDLGLWNKYVIWRGINPYAVNDGQIDFNDLIEFDSEFKHKENNEGYSLYDVEYYDANNGNVSRTNINIDNGRDLLYQLSKIMDDGNIIKSLNFKCNEE